MPEDLYTKWLQVEPGERPPDHYALLGLATFCDDQEAIEAAAQKQLARLDKYSLHPKPEIRATCQRMMNELARARTTLSLHRKSAYDQQLQSKLGGAAEPEADSPAVPEAPIEFADEQSVQSEAAAYLDELASAAVTSSGGAAARRGRRRRTSQWPTYVAAAMAVLFLVGGLAYWISTRKTEPPPARQEPGPLSISAPKFHPAPPVFQPSPVPVSTPRPPSNVGIIGMHGNAPLSEANVLTNSLGMKFVRINSGTFIMGSNPPQESHQPDETARVVDLSRSWFMGATHVTRGQFRAFATVTGYKTEAERASAGTTWQNPGFEQTENDPVVVVTWNDANIFIGWLNGQNDPRKYRLPTEAEWEYACRANGGPAFAFNTGFTISTEEANYDGRAKYGSGEVGVYRQKTTPVGSFAPNKWGLSDMHGNAWQWCSDAYGPYPPGLLTDPNGAMSAPNSQRVLRGGSWGSGPAACRSAFRDRRAPDYQSSFVGFRLCFDLDQSPPGPPLPTPPDIVAVHRDPVNTATTNPVAATREFTNTLGMKFVRLEPGTFMMGSPADEVGRRANETQHRVTLTRPFFMGIHHVTRAQFAAFVADTRYETASDRRNNGLQTWRTPGFKQEEDHPVVMMDWDDIVAFIAWLGHKDQRTYRLPTEAEWEYACRAGTTTPYNFGATFRRDLANYYEVISNARGRNGTTPVGSFAPNAWGLYDMHGNAWQYCSDYYGDLAPAEVKNPTGPEAAGVGARRVMRGGSWKDSPIACRAAYRSNGAIDFLRGFRLCLDVEATPSAPSTAPPDTGAAHRDPPITPTTTPAAVSGNTFTNAMGMKFVRIEPGTFMMGSPADEEGRGADETQHRVTLTHPFFMGIHHVTRAEFAAFVADTSYQTTIERANLGMGTWRAPGFNQSDTQPVIMMSWDDAVAFAGWVSQREHRRYRLPTEAEWEYACRAGTTTAFNTGANITFNEANFATGTYGNVKIGIHRGQTARVGSLPPNAWGLFEMHGNASQFCSDYFGDLAATDVRDPTGPPSGDLHLSHVVRGGSMIDDRAKCRSASRRSSFSPNTGIQGFRLCLAVDPMPAAVESMWLNIVSRERYWLRIDHTGEIKYPVDQIETHFTWTLENNTLTLVSVNKDWKLVAACDKGPANRTQANFTANGVTVSRGMIGDMDKLMTDGRPMMGHWKSTKAGPNGEFEQLYLYVDLSGRLYLTDGTRTSISWVWEDNTLTIIPRTNDWKMPIEFKDGVDKPGKATWIANGVTEDRGTFVHESRIVPPAPPAFFKKPEIPGH